MRSPILDLPLLAPAQAQKHVTVNETFTELDVLVQCSVQGMERNAPPATAAEGERWMVGPAPVGAWSGRAGRLASWRNGGWAWSTPRPGWRVYDLATDRLMAMDAAGVWRALSGGPGPSEMQNLTRLGIGGEASAGNPFTARLNDALWTARTPAEGGSGDLRMVLNKAEATRDAGLAFQSGYVTRAVAGLFGSDGFRLSVSADGLSFRDALTVDPATGAVALPQTPRFKAVTDYDNYAAVDVWTKIGINVAEANEQGAFDPATSRFVAPAAGLYLFGATLLHKINSSNGARMRARLVRNGAQQVAGSFGEISSSHLTLATALWIQAVAPLAAGDTVELQGSYRVADGYFAAGQTSFWGFKIG